ncbi:MAG TPA: hypothetical protein O0Y13_05270 [Methanocorpusculum sp.]|nr:hypothetical protein [Methanocorpusculum sp.]HJK63451.1 hypothetical protein [Methanocorpusculum sp.]HJK68460.1 hypothetical protein [Methanocorpusculum sp.]
MSLCMPRNGYMKMPKLGFNPSNVANDKGNASVTAAVAGLISVIVVIVFGIIITGSFTTVATSASLNLDEKWLTALNTTTDIAATSFNLAALIPIAMVAGVVISIVTYMIVR